MNREGVNMSYCVIKGTRTIIDNNANEEVMLENARIAGFSTSEVEIIELSESELNSQAHIPTLQEKNRADIDYLAIIQGVDL